MDAAEDQPVLSEVHMETCPPNVSAWCTRFCYSLLDEPARSNTIDVLDSENATECLPTTLQEIQHTPAAVTATGSTCHTQDAHSNCTAGNKATCISLDNDGDLVLPTRPIRRSHYITVHHSLATPVSQCGEQVWLGACVLCDWLLQNRQRLAGQTVVELGAGVGLTSILAAQYARQVILTDADTRVLQLASKNIAANAVQQQAGEHLSNNSRPKQQLRVAVRQLDWLQLFDTKLPQLTQEEVLDVLNSNSSNVSSPADDSTTSGAGAVSVVFQGPETASNDRQQQQQQDSSYAWSTADLSCLASASIWLAADVVYNETITDAFMHAVYQLMCWQHQQQLQRASHSAVTSGVAARHDRSANPCGHVDLPCLYVAVEKRYNFTYRDLDARASAFEHFLTYVQTQPDCSQQQPDAPCQRQQHKEHKQQQQQQQQVQADHTSDAQQGSQNSTATPLFQGKQLNVARLPQAMVYDRSSDLELWELVPLLR